MQNEKCRSKERGTGAWAWDLASGVSGGARGLVGGGTIEHETTHVGKDEEGEKMEPPSREGEAEGVTNAPGDGALGGRKTCRFCRRHAFRQITVDYAKLRHIAVKKIYRAHWAGKEPSALTAVGAGGDPTLAGSGHSGGGRTLAPWAR